VLFSWLTRRRRAKLLATPFPTEWLGYLERNVTLYAQLNEREKAKLRNDLRILVAEKHWEGCGGLVMTDEVKVTIAAHAALLLLGISHDYFARVMSILVYPTGFRSPDGWTRADGVVDLTVGALGQAWYDGPVVLAWDAVVQGGCDPRDGLNVVLHEFAHQLDYLDGVIDGTPPLRRNGDYAKWQEVMTREFERLKVAAERGTPKVLDEYGATNHAEFFAVATEAFFEKSREMYTRHPELYGVLSEYYGQDPAARDRAVDTPPEPSAAEPKQPHRTSRVAAKIEPHAKVALEWPGWVRFWEIHPGVSRSQALLPLESHVTYAIGFLFVFVIGLAESYLHQWRWNALMVIAPLLSLIMVVFAVWLRLAVRWVDRNGIWGGEYRPDASAGETTSQDGELPAPLS
jgi:Mlc titration factor MtfA (ptsG expression regulator)